MIKKIKVEQLKPGMYVHDFNCSWLKHPFLRNKLKIPDERTIKKIIQHGIREVYIDTAKGLDVQDTSLENGIQQEIQDQLAKVREADPAATKGIPGQEKRPDRKRTTSGIDKVLGLDTASVEKDAPQEIQEKPGGLRGAGPAAPRPISVQKKRPDRKRTTSGIDRVLGLDTAPVEKDAPQEIQEKPDELRDSEPAAPRSISVQEEAPDGTRETAGVERVSGPDAPSSETETPQETQTEPPEAWEAGPAPAKSVPLQEEMLDAIRVQKEAKQIVNKILEDAKLGKQIQMEKVYPTVGKVVDSILRNQDALLTLNSIKKADDYTYMHSLSVCVLMVCFSNSLYLSRDKVIQAGAGALLHDVGKVKVPQEILHKVGKLSEEEEEKLKEHVEHGKAILSKTPGISSTAMLIATEHHERYDGTGYPKGLKGEEISLYGQMAAVVNMYDILTSDRWYRKGMEPTAALSKLHEWSRFHFSEEMVQKFIRCIGIYPIGTLVRLESGLLGVVLEQGTKDLLHPVVRTIYDTRRKWFIKPRDIDLSNPIGKGMSDRIVCHEAPDKWKIRPMTYLASMEESGPLSRRLRGGVLQ